LSSSNFTSCDERATQPHLPLLSYQLTIWRWPVLVIFLSVSG